jgi:hypothetical protein
MLPARDWAGFARRDGFSGTAIGVFAERPACVKIIDFGVALNCFEEGEEYGLTLPYATHHTLLGGAPAYLAPEIVKVRWREESCRCQFRGVAVMRLV